MASEQLRPAGQIYGARTLTQEIFAYFDGLCGFEFLGANYRKPFLGPVRFDLRSRHGQILRSTVLDGIHDNRQQAVFWHPLARSRGRCFVLEISAASLARQSPITAWTQVPDQNAHHRLRCRLGGELLAGGLRRRLFYSWAGMAPKQFDRRSFDARVQGVMVDGTVSEKGLAERQRQLSKALDEQWCWIEPGDRCLEIGAGLGDLSHELAARADQWIGFEPNPSIRRVLKQRMRVFASAGVCPHGAIADLPRGPFDVIVWHAGTLRESAGAIVVMLKRLRADLRPGGRLFIDDLDQGDAVAWSRYVPIETREDYVAMRPTVEDPVKRRLLRQLECAGFTIERVEWHSQRLMIRASGGGARVGGASPAQ